MLVEKARKLSYKLHYGQKDKAGKPYYLHPFAVAEMVESDKEKIVAYLHDTVEDTEYTEFDLYIEWGTEIGDAVMAMTHRMGEKYHDYIMRVKETPLARTVKLADLEHNMDISRIPHPRQKDFDRVKKYEKATRKLL